MQSLAWGFHENFKKNQKTLIHTLTTIFFKLKRKAYVQIHRQKIIINIEIF